MSQYRTYIIAAVGALLLLWLLWQEYRRTNKRFLTGRILVSILAVVSLAMLGISLHSAEKEEEQTPVPPSAAIVAPPRFLACNWERHLGYLQPVHFTGRYHNTTSSTIRIHLSFAGETLDSITIPASKDTTFRLQTVPPFLGTGLLKVMALAGKDTLSTAPVPVEVAPVQPLRVLFVAASPDVENRFLADWLSSQGMAVAMRSQVAARQYSTRFDNMSNVSLDALTTGLLDKFDVVVADRQALTATEKATLTEYMQHHDIGLLLHPDSNTVVPQIAGEVLLKDSMGKPSAVMHHRSMGKVLEWGNNSTYTWQLSGDSMRYRRFWSTLLSAAARSMEPKTTITLAPAFAAVNNEVTITLRNTGPLLDTVVNVGETRLPLAQHPLLPAEWRTTWWPGKNGWQLLKYQNIAINEYIFGPDEWPELQRKRSVVADKAAESSLAAPASWWWAIAFLAACIILWIEKKL
ncbi:hypothetical protein CLV59_104259 [Chitinophaga dinghuensis]|uniref:Uncharacterized protein n=1 Tax=Chitinophaga dinghuensis TaxID=1539050 RepID=A0A327W1X9_9BACT|nr:hypothetical protein [Chitinophaga dinghuensis]RAJ82034.1 hypothetical protein CLV59_104259 [Chitinophaga dinghuensis]